MKIMRGLPLVVIVLGAGPSGAQAPLLEALRSAPPALVVTAKLPAKVPRKADAFPNEFKILSRAGGFELRAGERSVGRVDATGSASGREFSFTDSSGRCAAKSRARAQSWGSQMDALDCDGKSVGIVQEHVYDYFVRTYAIYTLLDARGHELGSSAKVHWRSEDVTIRSASGSPLLELRRPNDAGTWTVKVLERGAVDPRLAALAAAYKTSVEDDRR